MPSAGRLISCLPLRERKHRASKCQTLSSLQQIRTAKCRPILVHFAHFTAQNTRTSLLFADEKRQEQKEVYDSLQLALEIICAVKKTIFNLYQWCF